MQRSGQLVRDLFERVFNGDELDLCGELFAPDYTEHAVAPFGNREPGSVDGPEHMRSVVAWLRAQYPDVTMTIESLVADGDMVAALVRSEGTNLGPLNGLIPPTGKRFSGLQSHWYRVDGDKLVEHWAVRDDLLTMIQLGVIEPPGPPS